MNISWNIVKRTELAPDEIHQLFLLWNDVYPINLAYTTISGLVFYLDNLIEPEHYLVLSNTQEILGWGTSFTRDEERWFAILLAERAQNQGWGKALLNILKESNETLNGWVIDTDNYSLANGNRYPSPIHFYLKNGFHLMPSIRLELPQLSAVKIQSTK